MVWYFFLFSFWCFIVHVCVLKGNMLRKYLIKYLKLHKSDRRKILYFMTFVGRENHWLSVERTTLSTRYKEGLRGNFEMLSHINGLDFLWIFNEWISKWQQIFSSLINVITTTLFGFGVRAFQSCHGDLRYSELKG